MVACRYPQRRNPLTGRCKKPCARHQEVNPDTGKCVSKSYLRSVKWRGYDSDDDFSYLGYKPYSDLTYSDLNDKLVYDPGCKPPQMLNLRTGRCKTPCGPHQVVNKYTGKCVSRKHMRSVDYNMYDTDDDDYMLSETLFFPRMSYIDRLASIYGKTDLRDLNNETALTLNDMRVMEQLKIGNDEITEQKSLCGVYDCMNRLKCATSTVQGLISSLTKSSQCGLSKLDHLNKENSADTMHRLLIEADKNTNAFAFVCSKKNYFINFYYDVALKAAKQGKNAKLLAVIPGGVWQIIIPKNAQPEVPSFSNTGTFYEQAKEMCDNAKGKMKVAFYDYEKAAKGP